MNLIKKFRKKFKSTLFYEYFVNFFGSWKKSYAENYGEDLFVQYFFQKKISGIYVDIGCNLPKSRSLTYLLYKKNWMGIKVDISPRSIKLNNLLRPKDINLNLSVGKEEKNIDAFIFYDNCSMNTVDKKFKVYTQKSVNKKPDIFKIKQLKLNTILENHNIKKIDYLNIDVEGNEENVLAGFNLKKYKPELISIEIHSKTCPPTNNKIYKYFMKSGYHLTSIYGWTYFFSKMKDKNIHFEV
jgi:FkbM family methyltransferase